MLPSLEVRMNGMNLNGTRLLREWQSREGINRKQAAERLSVGLPTLDSWLQGNRRPGLAAARVIEEATGGLVKTDDWLTGEELATVRSAGN